MKSSHQLPFKYFNDDRILHRLTNDRIQELYLFIAADIKTFSN